MRGGIPICFPQVLLIILVYMHDDDIAFSYVRILVVFFNMIFFLHDVDAG
jgi:hypothetical protein